MKKFLSILISCYLGFCALVYYYPQPFFYNPSNTVSSIENAQANGYNAKLIKYTSADSTNLYAWYSKPTDATQVILFLHGNSHNIEGFYHKLISFQNKGYATFIAEYRGFGGINGTISQQNLSQDAIAAIKKLNDLGYQNKNIYVYGLSLGTYLATNAVVSQQKNGNFAGLILEVPFDSLLNTAKSKAPFLPLSLILKDKYETSSIIKDVKTKILIMLGTNDKTIPYTLGKDLYNQANDPKEIIIYKGAGHSNLFNFRNDKDIIKWLNK